ncbi:MAG: hypothetical protein JKX85_00135, partial [Phycisphaeraceae bacterium]|nr:hypothetical protein [Phycisphaeraceae bacterium]
MSTFTGMGGTVNGANTVRSWSVNESEANKEYSASNTQGGTGQAAGIKDWSGSYTCYGHTPVHMPGDIFTFAGFDGAKISTGTAIVSEIALAINQEGGDLQGLTVTFAGDGALTHTTGTDADVSLPDPPSSIGCKIEIDTGAGFVELVDVRTASLSIKSDLKEYSSSSTGGWKKRKAGRISANGSFDFYDQDVRTAPDIAQDAKLRVYVSDTEFWLFHWARIADGSYEPSPESGDTVSGSVNWNWTGF